MDHAERWLSICLRLHACTSAGELQALLLAQVAGSLVARRVLLVLHEEGISPVILAHLPRGESAADLHRAITPWLAEARQDRTAWLHHGPAGAAEPDQRSCLVATLVAQGEVLGFIYADIEGAFGRFDDSHRELLAQLAAQAAIALHNAQRVQTLERKLDERTGSLDEARVQQTAMSQVLELISRSTFELETLLQTLAENATKLCGADFGVFFRPAGNGNYAAEIGRAHV